ncbi:RNA polymerase sigma-70 factor, ECF subfamily [Tangfeifania diversioriginum]|uniref:RNA polymerase sigma-70 factor, ECF subfamily n=1 Tax=Tangfeifania diversioriginum TaxID=1168035 RepID=A0A1M6MRP3_9BACT|nr:RNA polymerase sigma factor [Tangfeifania diversioriginum]SHJ86124.1 RNA polymerase sigma-70 factor, ECF subfamily [Tangfeifania diversioriginum]
MTQIQFNTQLHGLHDELYYYALKLTTNREKAKDLIQETFLKAISYRAKYRHDKNFKGWVFTIMRNTFINNYRRDSKGININPTSGETSFLEFADTRPSPSADSYANVNDIYRCINSLSKAYRIPFNLFLKGYKYNEIADELALPMGTVKSRIFFARKKIQKALID